MDEKIVRFSWPHENDLVFRRDAIEAIIRETNQDGAYGYGDTKSLVNVLDALPSAHPDIPDTNVGDIISRQEAIDELTEYGSGNSIYMSVGELKRRIETLPSAQSDNRLSKIAELVEGTIDHFDLDDAMDLLYQIKEVLR